MVVLNVRGCYDACLMRVAESQRGSGRLRAYV